MAGLTSGKPEGMRMRYNNQSATRTRPMDTFLSPGRFIDSDSPQVAEFAQSAIAGASGDVAQVRRLYGAVRDAITYDPYVNFADPANFRASGVLAARRGFCVGKSALLAACCRATGIPARVGFADVRNHLTSPKLYQKIKTDVFIWHSYAELFVAGRWVKSTPAFDATLCQRVGIAPLEFDGQTDSLFHPFDRAGRRHMEYLQDRGSFADVPFETMLADFRAHYPTLIGEAGISGDFRAEAVAATD
jgi:transglutaminase-like putative cysteine protease